MQSHPERVEIPCPICGSGRSDHLFWTKDYVFRVSDQRFGVRRCGECGAGFLSPRPPAEAIGYYYPEAFYWAWEGAEGELDWSAIVEKRSEQLAAKAQWISRRSPGRLLDIGAQKGEFLWFMQEKGWEVHGVEMDPKVPNPGQLPIRYGDFLEMDLGDQRFDVVTFWAVLEHVYDPQRFVEKAVRLLNPGGQLVVLVTNFDSIQSRLYQADDYPRHLTLFTRSSVSRLCAANGLELDRLVTDQRIFGGSLNGGLVYATKRMLGYRSEEALAEWKQLEDPDLFWCKWRGKASTAIKMMSRVDRLLSYPVEKLLDWLGYGFILTFSATKTKTRD